MFHPQTRKRGNPIAPAPTPMPTPTINLGNILVTKNSYHNEVDHFPRYDEIYIIFSTSSFPPKDENL